MSSLKTDVETEQGTAIPPSGIRQKLKALVLNLSAACISLFATLAIAEILVRLFIPLPAPLQERLHYTIFETSENMRLRYKLSPNARNHQDGVFHVINSAGFRDREYSLEKPKGTTRIAFIGDSVTYGHGIKMEESLPKQLEQILTREKNKNIEILNMAVPGYDSMQEVELLKESGLSFKPDWVFVGYCLNDSQYASGELLWFHTNLDRKVKRFEETPYRLALKYLYAHSKLMIWLDTSYHIQDRFRFLRSYQSIYRYLLAAHKKLADSPSSQFRNLKNEILASAKEQKTSKSAVDYFLANIGLENDEMHSSHWHKITSPAFHELKELSETHGFKVAVIIYPFLQELDRYPLVPLHHFLTQEFQSLGFEVIDLMDWGKNLPKDTPQTDLSVDAVHMLPKTSTLAAEYLSKELTAKKIV